jgi:nicotinate-nucleotide adenylyltransferase
VDTLTELKRSRPGDELFLVLGWDAARDLRLWREPESVLQLAKLVVVTRPGWHRPSASDLAAAGIDPERTIICYAQTPDIEATQIRQLLDSGGSLDGLLDPAVERYIRDHNLYLASRRSFPA